MPPRRFYRQLRLWARTTNFSRTALATAIGSMAEHPYLVSWGARLFLNLGWTFQTIPAIYIRGEFRSSCEDTWSRTGRSTPIADRWCFRALHRKPLVLTLSPRYNAYPSQNPHPSLARILSLPGCLKINDQCPPSPFPSPQIVIADGARNKSRLKTTRTGTHGSSCAVIISIGTVLPDYPCARCRFVILLAARYPTPAP